MVLLYFISLVHHSPPTVYVFDTCAREKRTRSSRVRYTFTEILPSIGYASASTLSVLASNRMLFLATFSFEISIEALYRVFFYSSDIQVHGRSYGWIPASFDERG